MAEHHGCAARSRERGEALLGTASTARRWVLLEQPGAWGHDALTESQLDHRVAQQVQARARRLGARPVLVRRPGARASARPRTRAAFLVVVDAHAPQVRRLRLSAPEQLVGALDTALAEGIGAVGDPGPDRLVLVCTHGRHDTCCAVEGRPAAAALSAHLPDVWESSHVGGDRFAANVVVLPDGTYHGRLRPGDVAAFADGLQQGQLSLDHYRGRSLYPFRVQAADILLRRRLGLRALDDVEVLGHGDDPDGTVVVRLGTPAGTWQVRVALEPHPDAHLLTCRAQRPSHPPEYRLLDVRRAGSA